MARILLADDDAATRDMVSRALAADGHAVEVASDGQEALDFLQRTPGAFDLVISDIEMPGLDGISLVTAAAKLTPAPRLLLISGFETSAHRAADLGGVRCLTKPFSLEKIRAEVTAALA